jgi:hypothetical protein
MVPRTDGGSLRGVHRPATPHPWPIRCERSQVRVDGQCGVFFWLDFSSTTTVLSGLKGSYMSNPTQWIQVYIPFPTDISNTAPAMMCWFCPTTVVPFIHPTWNTFGSDFLTWLNLSIGQVVQTAVPGTPLNVYHYDYRFPLTPDFNQSITLFYPNSGPILPYFKQVLYKRNYIGVSGLRNCVVRIPGILQSDVEGDHLTLPALAKYQGFLSHLADSLTSSGIVWRPYNYFYTSFGRGFPIHSVTVSQSLFTLTRRRNVRRLRLQFSGAKMPPP